MSVKVDIINNLHRTTKIDSSVNVLKYTDIATIGKKHKNGTTNFFIFVEYARKMYLLTIQENNNINRYDKEKETATPIS